MIRFLVSLGILVYFTCSEVQGDAIYSKFMTPKWLYENAYFKPSAVRSHDSKRLILHQPLQPIGWLLTVPLPSVRSIQEDVVFKITVSAQNPKTDSDLHVGIGNARGVYAAAYIIDNRPYSSPLLLANLEFSNGTRADTQGSTVLSNPFDEQITFLYKPSERFGAFYSRGQVVTGIFSGGPDMSKDIYLVVSGDGNPRPEGEIYAIQYISVEIMH